MQRNILEVVTKGRPTRKHLITWCQLDWAGLGWTARSPWFQHDIHDHVEVFKYYHRCKEYTYSLVGSRLGGTARKQSLGGAYELGYIYIIYICLYMYIWHLCVDPNRFLGALMVVEQWLCNFKWKSKHPFACSTDFLLLFLGCLRHQGLGT